MVAGSVLQALGARLRIEGSKHRIGILVLRVYALGFRFEGLGSESRV